MPAPKRCLWSDVVRGARRARGEDGDRVLFLPQAGLEIEMNGEDYLLLRERDVQAVMSPADGNDRQPGQYL